MKTILVRPHIALLAAAGFLIVAAQQPARADQITYTFSGIGSGRLGASFFTNTAFTVTALADPSQVTDILPPVLNVLNFSTTISVAGLGSATFNTNFHTLDFNNPNPSESSVGLFLFYQGPKLISVQNAAFQSYYLTTSYGPVAGTPGFSTTLFPTTAGDFSFSAVSSVSFQAVLQAVPEPTALGCLGVASVVWAIRRKPPKRDDCWLP